MAAIDGTQKAEIYETLSSLNIAFTGILQHLQTLEKTGLFKSKTAKFFPSFTQELQAEFNQEFLEDLHQLELDDWNCYGKARQRWEKEIRDPDDVFIHAEERKKATRKTTQETVIRVRNLKTRQDKSRFKQHKTRKGTQMRPFPCFG
jgi:hypothetical protein